MTAEVAILNKNAIAIAADSAITIGSKRRGTKQRVWKTSNKIFSLSPENDIAIMINGNGSFCGVPWETIIKLFAQEKNTRFDTVEECKREFLRFVGDFKLYDSRLDQLNTMSLIVDLIDSAASVGKGAKDKTTAKRAVDKILSESIESFSEIGEFCDIDCSWVDFKANYSALVVEALNEATDFSVPKRLSNKAVEYCYYAVQKRFSSSLETGVVIAGFGKEEYLPGMCSFVVDGRIFNGLRTWDANSIDMESWKTQTAHIQPFAQQDVTHLFMEGIDFDYMDFLESTIYEAFQENSKTVVNEYVPEGQKVVELALLTKTNRAALESLMAAFKDFRRKRVVDRVTEVVSSLPPEEMAAMAESLVEITSLRRRVDSDVESVAGPVDVVLISKGDGLVWMKRKHYFDSQTNQDFSSRREQRRKGK